MGIRHSGRYINPILPLELSPHTSELVWAVNTQALAHGTRTYLSFGTIRRLDVVHDINMDVVQDDTLLSHPGPLPQDASKDNTGFCR